MVASIQLENLVCLSLLGALYSLEIINYILSFVFLVEMTLKHIGPGPRKYWSNGFDVLVRRCKLGI